MLARIANDLYWVGRHVARAEHTARMLDGLFQLELEGGAEDPRSVPLSWQSVSVVMGAGRLSKPREGSLRDEVIAILTSDEANPMSIVSCVAAAREGARQLRETLPSEAWETLNSFHLNLKRRNLAAGSRTGPYSPYSYVKERGALFWGLAGATMQRDEAYAFLHVGGRVEAAAMVLRMLRVALPPVRPADDERAEMPRRDGNAIALLRAIGGLQAFVRSAAAPPRAEPVANFLLYERSFPDSIAGSLERIHTLLSRAEHDATGSTPILRLARLLADLELRRRTGTGAEELPAAFREIQQELGRVESDISQRYFSADGLRPQRVLAP